MAQLAPGSPRGHLLVPAPMSLPGSTAASSPGPQRPTLVLCQDKTASQQTGPLMGCVQPCAEIPGRKDRVSNRETWKTPTLVTLLLCLAALSSHFSPFRVLSQKAAVSHGAHLRRAQELGTLQCTDAAWGRRKLKSKLKARQKVQA